MKVILASQNAHKRTEIAAIVEPFGLELALQSELGIHVDVEETGCTFEENSMLKARAVMEASGMDAIADDSGLEVDALGGAPGIYSARYGGERCRSDRERYEFLLQQMDGVPQEKRTARFVSVITLLRKDGTALVARGECPGEILTAPRGEYGFGYDPVFFVPAVGKTMAELTAGEKNAISHRARALKKLAQLLSKENQNADK